MGTGVIGRNQGEHQCLSLISSEWKVVFSSNSFLEYVSITSSTPIVYNPCLNTDHSTTKQMTG